MKEFEKWKDDNCVKHCNLYHIGVCGDCGGIGTKADTWKAALEWVLSNWNGETDMMMLGMIIRDEVSNC